MNNRKYISRLKAALFSPNEEKISDVTGIEKMGIQPEQAGTAFRSRTLLRCTSSRGSAVQCFCSGPCSRLVDATGTNHEQLQENEDRRRDQAKPELSSLLHQLLAQQHLKDELEAENREDPEEAQHS